MSALPQSTSTPELSGRRFCVVYRIAGSEAEARERALDIGLEQTVEFPEALVPRGPIREQIVGRLESLEPAGERACRAVMSFAVETASAELTQLLNVVFGNISLKPRLRVEEIHLGPELEKCFRGPRFGMQGLRERLGVEGRPLLCTALKPMGLSPAELAELAYAFARGGIDLIKDDHGLADQPFCPFHERVERCAAAVQRANLQTGQRCAYVPNVTAGPRQLEERALLAKRLGAGALLLSPGLAGFDAMRQLADNDEVALPLLSHPAFQGSFVADAESGMSHFALFGQMVRLAGGDASIFPNFGGRFSFTREECQAIVRGTQVPMGTIRRIFPVPAGGMSLANVDELSQVYGRDLILLVGGGLFRHGPDLVENCRVFRGLAERFQA